MVQEPQDFHEFMPNEVWKWKILEEKIKIIQKELSTYKVELRGFSMEDM